MAPQARRLCEARLAQNLNPRDPNWENRKFNEVMFVKRIDDATIFVQKSLNGKLKDPPGERPTAL